MFETLDRRRAGGFSGCPESQWRRLQRCPRREWDMSDTDQVHSTRSVVIPSIEMRLGQTARGPTAKVPQTAGTRTIVGPTTGKERTEVMVNIGNAKAAAIAGTIPIGPF